MLNAVLKDTLKTDAELSQVFAVAHTALDEGRGNGDSRNDQMILCFSIPSRRR